MGAFLLSKQSLKVELELIRTYYPKGTNGNLLSDGLGLCHTIELPWLDNQHGISCVPEGRYELVKRWSDSKKWHLLVCDVPNRDLILIHPANDALKELKGCIAPVTTLIGQGRGEDSRVVFNKLKNWIYPILERNEKVFLNIKSNQDEHSAKSISTHT
jgi:Family of unknown function (DUF5675)